MGKVPYGKGKDSLKSTFKRVKSHIQKGANPKKAARRIYENACDYFEMLNQRILIQQRALACLSISPEGAVCHGQHWPAERRG